MISDHDRPPPAKTAADEILKEFEETENDPCHEKEPKRRRGKTATSSHPTRTPKKTRKVNDLQPGLPWVLPPLHAPPRGSAGGVREADGQQGDVVVVVVGPGALQQVVGEGVQVAVGQGGGVPAQVLHPRVQ